MNTGASKHLPLQEAIARANWRIQISCYARCVLALFWSTRRRRSSVQDQIHQLRTMALPKPAPEACLIDLLRHYTEGVHLQATGDFGNALSIYQQPKFSLDTSKGRPHLDICLLATFNRLWILQHPSYQDHQAQTHLMEQVVAVCARHPDREIQTIFHISLVVIKSPQTAVQTTKSSLNIAIKQSQATGNALHSALALCALHAFMFEGLVSTQALKSSQAASVQAARAGNMLWMSVADRILAQSYEVHGQMQNSVEHRIRSARLAQIALSSDIII